MLSDARRACQELFSHRLKNTRSFDADIFGAEGTEHEYPVVIHFAASELDPALFFTVEIGVKLVAAIHADTVAGHSRAIDEGTPSLSRS